MNRTVVIALIVAAALGTAYAAVRAGAEVRKAVLVSRCEADGRSVGLFQAPSPTDTRPDGFLPFHCLDRSEL